MLESRHSEESGVTAVYTSQPLFVGPTERQIPEKGAACSSYVTLMSLSLVSSQQPPTLKRSFFKYILEYRYINK